MELADKFGKAHKINKLSKLKYTCKSASSIVTSLIYHSNLYVSLQHAKDCLLPVVLGTTGRSCVKVQLRTVRGTRGVDTPCTAYNQPPPLTSRYSDESYRSVSYTTSLHRQLSSVNTPPIIHFPHSASVYLKNGFIGRHSVDSSLSIGSFR